MIDLSLSHWPGIPQDSLTKENRQHIALLCHAFCTAPYNVLVNWKQVEWGKPWTFFPVRGSHIATIDNPILTRLVFAAHDECVRVEIAAHTFQHLMIGMHSNRTRVPSTMKGHPTLEEALISWRARHSLEDVA